MRLVPRLKYNVSFLLREGPASQTGCQGMLLGKQRQRRRNATIPAANQWIGALFCLRLGACKVMRVEMEVGEVDEFEGHLTAGLGPRRRRLVSRVVHGNIIPKLDGRASPKPGIAKQLRTFRFAYRVPVSENMGHDLSIAFNSLYAQVLHFPLCTPMFSMCSSGNRGGRHLHRPAPCGSCSTSPFPW